MRSFLCALYAPPCVPNIGVAMPPCRRVCQAAARCQKMVTESNFAWRDEWKCAQFPQEGEMCINNKDLKRTGNAPTVATPVSQQIQKTWPDVKPRRYDITDQGSSKLFRGWVDIQGQGAANDYCRIIAGGNRRKQFLACTLAGSTDDAALYVSKRGFDTGHRNSWFMRDMDGDGRDDYCRCVGRGVRSKIYCMKAGLHGFYGGPLQPGNEYTFAVPTSGPCLDKTINPFIGIH
ncbi:hypothetical protein LSAT2_024122 [Lamellibrachia satsuma]|nr:hypothetical protein LSAT2_024122 [Lamellibrachia satsuma]